MEWSWDHAFAVLPQLAEGLVVTIQATIVASLLAYVLGLGIAILKMSKSKLTRV
ncbi:MAG: ectoine/hydroxyectoine ABC transporter permease subunit EhuD, partial [Thiotrichales bacterium]|nr:ectoine/hydroxyectoine ABC transporter permease subunit EhuD [Thiotrichales bacterium]